MTDDRTRREKLEAIIAPDSGATDGERSNARDLLDKMEPEATASEGVINFGEIPSDEYERAFSDMMDFWRVIESMMDPAVKRQMHDDGGLVSMDASGRCTICKKVH